MGKDLESLVAPTIMAVIFVAVLVVILQAQNPRRRAEAKAREHAAEAADPRFRSEERHRAL